MSEPPMELIKWMLFFVLSGMMGALTIVFIALAVGVFKTIWEWK